MDESSEDDISGIGADSVSESGKAQKREIKLWVAPIIDEFTCDWWVLAPPPPPPFS